MIALIDDVVFLCDEWDDKNLDCWRFIFWSQTERMIVCLWIVWSESEVWHSVKLKGQDCRWHIPKWFHFDEHSSLDWHFSLMMRNSRIALYHAIISPFNCVVLKNDLIELKVINKSVLSSRFQHVSYHGWFCLNMKHVRNTFNPNPEPITKEWSNGGSTLNDVCKTCIEDRWRKGRKVLKWRSGVRKA